MTDTRIVLDLETKKTFDEVGGRNALDKLGISVVGIYRYETGKYETYLEEDFGKLQNLLIDSSLIIGFNHIQFDMPVLQPYLSVDVKTLPCFDIMLDLQEKIGHRVGLDAIAKATLGLGKIATGLDAIKYYREGRWDELKEYCLKDVEVTKDVYEHGLKKKQVSFTSKFGNNKKDIKVNWADYGKNQAILAKQESTAEPAQYKLF
ncbi:MAG: ribonuclease H-like domain-containing protein [Deltaproteobacteria bacterium]|nr:ribonuclease H-like domain-containing protein [Deltaproteobacteria bacterium]